MTAAVLFRKIQVVTPQLTGQTLVLADAFVAVAAGRILTVGTDEDQARQALAEAGFTDFEVYEGRRKILWPAMANTHGHIPMTLMRNQTDDHNLHDWLFNYIFPREEHLTPEHVYHGTLLGLAEMIRSGTGTAADMYYESDQVAAAALKTGLRLNVCCDGKTDGPDGRKHLQRPALDAFIRNWQGSGDGLIQVALMVHSIYLYEPYLYAELAEAARETGCYVQVHVSETSREVEECLARYGCRPPRQLAKFGLLDGPTVAAHCVHLDDDDRQLLAEKKVLVAHNPSSNLKLGSGIADVAAMLAAGIRVGLGTDGAASNNNLNLYQEMRLASLLAKGSSGDAARLPAGQALRMATLDGQQGLGFADCGCIAPGWQADLQIVDADRPAMWPLGDAAAALVYSAEGSFVESLMVAGRWLMRKHELLTLDEEQAKYYAASSSAALTLS
jgi:5-methylthioadenosine/S-adenosylhomocysteine deaminase